MSDNVSVWGDSDNLNKTKRMPIVFCLDTSGSMTVESRIEQLNMALSQFIRALKEKVITKSAAEIAIVTFDSEARVLQDFISVRQIEQMQIEASGSYTSLGQGIEKSLNLIERRRKELKGEAAYVPYLIIITDGEPNGDSEDYLEEQVQRVVQKAKSTSTNECVLTIPIGVGNDVSKEWLKKLSEGFLENPIIFSFANDLGALFDAISQSIKNSIGNGATVVEDQKECVLDFMEDYLSDFQDFRERR